MDQPNRTIPTLPPGLPDAGPGFIKIYELLGITDEEVQNDHSELMEAFRNRWRDEENA